MSNIHTMRANLQNKQYTIRQKFSIYLVKLARKIYPENPEVTAFHLAQAQDLMITGRAITRVSPMEILQEKDNVIE